MILDIDNINNGQWFLLFVKHPVHAEHCMLLLTPILTHTKPLQSRYNYLHCTYEETRALRIQESERQPCIHLAGYYAAIKRNVIEENLRA